MNIKIDEIQNQRKVFGYEICLEFKWIFLDLIERNYFNCESRFLLGFLDLSVLLWCLISFALYWFSQALCFMILYNIRLYVNMNFLR